jgi:hypothetical protein
VRSYLTVRRQLPFICLSISDKLADLPSYLYGLLGTTQLDGETVVCHEWLWEAFSQEPLEGLMGISKSPDLALTIVKALSQANPRGKGSLTAHLRVGSRCLILLRGHGSKGVPYLYCLGCRRSF